MGVGDRQRKAAIGVAVGKIVHPLALGSLCHQLRRKVVKRVADELHVASFISSHEPTRNIG
jgi:hypothetical protein